MPFSLGGKYGNEAFDAETGMHIRSLGARGPEIENQVWKIEVYGQNFEFHTYVTGRVDNNRHGVLLSPNREFLKYLSNSDIPIQDRKKVLDRAIDGIHFIFPTYFRAPIYFQKQYPLGVRLSEHGLWREAELSR